MIILASTSPRRKALLTELLGKGYTVISPEYEEDNSLKLRPRALVKHHSLGKARSVKAKPDDIVIGSDTIVLLDDRILGKPSSAEDARRMLRQISGRRVIVLTGIALIKGERILQDVVSTRVKIKALTDKEIDAYVRTGEPLDKAGAFGTQGIGAAIVESINGCYFSVVGLPLARLSEMLKELGYSVF